MDYDTIREIHLFEKNNPGIYPVSENFYSEVEGYIAKLKENIRTNMSMEDIRLYENTRKLFKEINEIREQKIITMALIASKSNVYEKDGMAKQERELFEAIINLLKQNRNRVNKIFGVKKKEESKGVKLRFISAVPQFMTPDKKVFGPFEPDQVVELPKDQAEILIKRKIAEMYQGG